MGIIIKKKKHFGTVLPFILLGILLITFGPLIIGIIGAWCFELFTGQTCNEGNCFWMVLPWFMIFTIPTGLILFITAIVIVIVDAVQLDTKNDLNKK